MKRFLSFPFLFGVFVGLGLFIPTPTEAATTMTQREYIRWVIQLSGDCTMMGSTITDEDFIKWANRQPMQPHLSQKGWDLDAALTKEVLAETLAQFFSLGKPKKGMDYERLLLREGITLPSAETISREDFVTLVDEIGFQGLTWTIAKCKHSPTKPDQKPHKPPMPPQPPKVKGPMKP